MLHDFSIYQHQTIVARYYTEARSITEMAVEATGVSATRVYIADNAVSEKDATYNA